jgi:hypothetical protein
MLANLNNVMGRVKPLCVAVGLLFVCRSVAFANEARELTPQEKKAVEAAVVENFKDPLSAQFKWLPFHTEPREGVWYCGLVNAKNSFGGYIGFTPFLVLMGYHAKTNAFVFASQPGGPGAPGDAVEAFIYKQCRKYGYDLSNAK